MSRTNKVEDQKVVSWKVVCSLSEEDVPVYEEILSALGAVIDVNCEDENAWCLTAFFGADVSHEKIKEAFLTIHKIVKCTESTPDILAVYEDEYQQSMQQSFEGFCVSSFFIHNGLEVVPDEMVEVVIPAEMAFGTGEHPTTEACLILYDQQSEKQDFTCGLDMGCGSAILSIAAAKLKGTPFCAVDNHAESANISKHNVAVNQVAHLVGVVQGNGFHTPKIKEQSYDIIFANILAEPLIQMSDDLVQALQPNGIAILSGFLQEQKENVYQAYQKQGCVVVDELTIANKVGTWVAAVVRKG